MNIHGRDSHEWIRHIDRCIPEALHSDTGYIIDDIVHCYTLMINIIIVYGQSDEK